MFKSASAEVSPWVKVDPTCVAVPTIAEGKGKGHQFSRVTNQWSVDLTRAFHPIPLSHFVCWSILDHALVHALEICSVATWVCEMQLPCGVLIPGFLIILSSCD